MRTRSLTALAALPLLAAPLVGASAPASAGPAHPVSARTGASSAAVRECGTGL